VRQDNALQRLGEIGKRCDLYSSDEREVIDNRLREEREIIEAADRTSITPDQAASLLSRAGSASIPHSVKVSDLAKRHGVLLTELFAATGVSTTFSPEALLSSELAIKYSGYFAREKAQAERMRSMGGFVLPADLAYDQLKSLSHEARQKLSSIQPRTLAQASRIPGVSPSDIQNLVIEVEKKRPHSLTR
jgi:tRNA uridine 5-carboxymethylaminomethyl modification enzyme